MHTTRTSTLALCSSLLWLAAGGPGQATDGATVRVPDSIVAQGVPDIPQAITADLLPFENIRTASFQNWHPTERRLLIGTRFGESGQLHEVAMPLGARTQLTFFREPAGGGSYRPGRPDQILFSVNEGGAENFQLFVLDRKSGRSRRLTDGVHRYQSAAWSRDGRWLAYASNTRNNQDFDLYVLDPDAASGGERRLGEFSGQWDLGDWSHDGKYLAVAQYISAVSTKPYLLEVATGKLTPLDPGQDAAYNNVRFSADDRTLYVVSDRGAEVHRLWRYEIATQAWTLLSGDIPWDVESIDLSRDGKRLAFFTNEDGIARLHAIELPSGKSLTVPELPAGVAGGLEFRPGSHEIAFTISWARAPSDVYSLDLGTGRLERWTASEVGGLPAERFVVPELVRFPTFDEVAPGKRRTIPAFVYRPDPARHPGKRPVYINIHGGPEGQSRPSFQGANNYWLDELGIALVVPNVRGSAGYGKTYLGLDDGYRREDSVKDIGAVLDWIATQPDLDAQRVMVGGGSYGGYMSLASMVFYSDRLRAGIDVVGISNFVTFLENTQAYRRDLRRVEYGDERDPKMREFLQRISPLGQVNKIRVPVLVAQGANDPRVPKSEAEQVVAALQANGQPVWYVLAKDEGHGFAKKTNTDYLRIATIAFMRQFLLN